MPSTRPLATVSTRALRPALRHLAACGVDPHRFLESCALDPATVLDPDVRLPLSEIERFWPRAVEVTGDDDVGLHCGTAVQADSFGPLSYLAVVSATLGDALDAVCRYSRLLADIPQYRLDADHDCATMSAVEPSHTPGLGRQIAEYSVAAVHTYASRQVGEAWRLTEVFFDHPKPARTDEHARVFAAPVRFDASTFGLRFPRPLLDLPMKARDPELESLLDEVVQQGLRQLPETGDVATRVQQVIGVLLPTGVVTLESVARRLGVGPRTLQRKLRAEGTSWQVVLDELRCSLACLQLTRRDLPLTEVALALGFSDPASFHRAFKRWTGTTPASYRRTHS